MGRMRAPMKGRPGMSSMAPASQLPGFPGASHPQHVGSTGFLRDRPQHITLSIKRQTAFNRIGEKSLLNAANSMGRIDDAGQVVWMLAASDAPDGLRRVPQSTSHIIQALPRGAGSNPSMPADIADALVRAASVPGPNAARTSAAMPALLAGASGMLDGMKEMIGGARKEHYPTLMALPVLTPETRAEVRALSEERICEGITAVGAGARPFVEFDCLLGSRCRRARLAALPKRARPGSR